MPTIQSLILGCSNPTSQQQFYRSVLGMQQLADGSVSYGAPQASIQFIPANSPYEPQSHDLYWKIAIAVADINLAYQQLTEKGIEVTAPKQFQDIGFLAHFTDPEGFKIELIEHWFEGNRPDTPVNPNLLGGGAHFNLITLRTTDIKSTCDFCTAAGLTLLSVQAVENYGFTLYFFAYTDDIPPSADVTSIDNREWLYQRPYTILEIQHVQNATTIILPKDQHAGYINTIFSELSSDLAHNKLLVRSAAGNDSEVL